MNHKCKKCGYTYNSENQKPPENATFYWEPKCPWCNAKITATAVDDIDMQSAKITLKNLGMDYKFLDKIQARARHLHGRETEEQLQGEKL